MKRGALLAVAIWLAVVIIRITAPSDIATGDQPLQIAYIHDIVANGNWLVQHLADGTVASKPPLYNWLAAIPIVITGISNEFMWKLPSIICSIIALLLAWDLGRRIAGERAATIAACLMATTPLFVKHVYFARTDMLLTLLIVVQMWSAFTERPKLMWIAAALAMLTKGPVGIVLPLLAIIAWRRIKLFPGLLLAFVPFLIWFGAALYVERDAVWNQLVMSETVNRFAGSKESRHVLYYVPHLIARMAPASLIALSGAREVWRRRRERHDILFAALWVLVMLAVLSLVPSKRADRLFPILPAMCILAGWAAQQWRTWVLASIVIVMLIGNAVYQLLPDEDRRVLGVHARAAHNARAVGG